MLLLLFAVVSSVLAECPIGTTYHPEFNRCYLFVSDPQPFGLAEDACAANKGHVVSVTNGFENAMLAEDLINTSAQPHPLANLEDNGRNPENIQKAKRDGVAIAVSGPLKEHVSSVNRVSDRIISLRIATKDGFWTVVSVYAPQCGCTEADKEAFYEELDDVIRSAPEGDFMTVAGDFNGHVGQDRQGFERVHGGISFGRRNQEGEGIIELAEVHDLAIASTFFIKRESQKITYCSGGRQKVAVSSGGRGSEAESKENRDHEQLRWRRRRARRKRY
ncbi:hypothetical protein ANCCEY_04666 [Ancylostoma ceylanicum]|uniref:C-type lectin domain-containing protein n=1 Tax=Ancylostoma ceylanicum TaxID=53326 RepID=A0A0D6LWN7_9BILA|nr:hypothetical protein ANCCEY_04666 [Ancylostoma ceylanicum]